MSQLTDPGDSSPSMDGSVDQRQTPSPAFPVDRPRSTTIGTGSAVAIGCLVGTALIIAIGIVIIQLTR